MNETAFDWHPLDEDTAYQKYRHKDQLEVQSSELIRWFSKCFSTDEGQRILAYLCTITLDRALTANASSDTLRHLEGQRFLVRHILNLSQTTRDNTSSRRQYGNDTISDTTNE